jgi:hypothetical protein
MNIHLDDRVAKQVKVSMKKRCVDFDGDADSFECYIERLIMEDIGNV